MAWRQFVMNLESLDPDRVETTLSKLGALSVTLTDAGDEPMLEPAPGETPLWAQTRITALFDAGADLDLVAAGLQHTLGLPDPPVYQVEVLDDRPWEREWLKDFGPMQFGERLWIVPGDRSPAEGNGVVVRLDPGLAFGTGTHPTTALCLEWLERADLDGKSMLDFGCGSGILGIAALKLGAATVFAVDIDEQAVSATRRNAARNGVDSGLRAGSGAERDSGGYDIIVANILAGTLVDNVEWIRDAAKPGARIALSGILAGQVDEVRDAYRRYFDLDPPMRRGDWALVSGQRV